MRRALVAFAMASGCTGGPAFSDVTPEPAPVDAPPHDAGDTRDANAPAPLPFASADVERVRFLEHAFAYVYEEITIDLGARTAVMRDLKGTADAGDDTTTTRAINEAEVAEVRAALDALRIEAMPAPVPSPCPFGFDGVSQALFVATAARGVQLVREPSCSPYPVSNPEGHTKQLYDFRPLAYRLAGLALPSRF
jgi:hypothetical protein